ncbi:putative sugar transferase EpsL [Clostridium tepidiprofundi DSM 19306]|uniref:Putative sugar transferase EpsL n=1 Tax=Clostridium tepidiprofundi DSM 19306 TaxID=1121338 RepID=A0A151ASR8_9CLOT|nr:sugar transferase [Clostridium tepidiprofundi]KYH30427.1 putative sugar transferase EpsL [Clostridium tepidiprofundi DSM 19306]
MSIIGPRPILWNQFDLIEERGKYGVNDIYQGLTGWTQINKKDEIYAKAKFDSEYVNKMGIAFDTFIFIKSIQVVISNKGIREGYNNMNI